MDPEGAEPAGGKINSGKRESVIMRARSLRTGLTSLERTLSDSPG